MATNWYIEATTFGNCNCDYNCPCQFELHPTHGGCRGFEVGRIERGHFGTIQLDGLHYAVTYAWPGAIFEGNGSLQAIIDERADDQQRQALISVLHGGETEEATTHWWVFRAMSSTVHEPIFRRFEEALEPERYEIFDLLDSLTPARREFLKALGGGLLFLVTVRGAQGQEVQVRVQVAEDGTWRAFTGKIEMGQGSRTLLTQAFAEELGVPVERVQLVMGDTLLCPDDGGTWSSLTSPQTVPVIRQAAAAVRAARTKATEALTAPARWSAPWYVRASHGQPRDRHRQENISHGRGAGRGPACRHHSQPVHRATLLSYDASAIDKSGGVRIVRDGDLLAAIAAESPRRQGRGRARHLRMEAATGDPAGRLAGALPQDRRRPGRAAQRTLPAAAQAW